MIDTELRGAAALEALEAEGRLFAYPAEVARVMQRDPRTIYAGIEHGEIPATRVGQRYQVSVAWLKRAAEGDANLMEPIVVASRAYVTMGEMCDTLRDVWGVWRETPVF